MLNISCVGDSLTYGASVEDREINCYPAVLNDLLGDDYVVANFGVNGHTLLKTGDFPYWEHENFKFSAMIEPDIVIIMLGTNDSKPFNFTNLCDFISTYEEMIAYYHKIPSQPRVYMVTPPKVFPSTSSEVPTIRGEVVDEIAEAIRALGKKTRISVIDVNKKTADYPEGFVEDGIHTNKKGAKFIAEIIFRELSKK